MLKSSVILITGGMVLAACTKLNSPVEAKSPSGPKPASLPIQRQKSVTQLYDDTCAKCHGANGEGGGGGTPSLNTKDKYNQKWDKPFLDTIKKGHPEGGMEAYGETMSDEQIWGLVVHIRELQSRALRAQFGSPKATKSGVFRSQRSSFKLETVVDRGEGLEVPWSIDWLPDGRMLVTNLTGAVLLRTGTKLTPITGIPNSIRQGQGGMMDVAVHPNYKKNGWIYLAFADPAKNGRGAMTKIVRGKLSGSASAPAWTGQQTIFEAEQEFYNGAGIHFGSRIAFDGKGHVFFVVGERGGNMLAQRLDTPFGKIYRVNEDGSVPKDNPFIKEAAGNKLHVGAIWTLGHRNPQGLAFDLTGNLWDTEHGPRGGDEVNRIQKGANYGWPVIAFSINYNDSPFQTPWPKQGQNFTMPVFRWLPSTGACGLDVYRGSAFPMWKGDLIAGGLAGQNLDRIRISDDKVVEQEELLQGMGRIREVAVGPDGYVYVALNQPDKIIRLVPAK